MANAACGLCGAMPPTGVWAQTSVNQLAGATHRTSQMMQAFFIFALTNLCAQALSYLPLAAAAAILATAGIRMVPVAYCRLVAEHPQRFLLLALVAIVSFAIDPVVGIILGTVVALLGSAQAASTARGRLS